MYNQTLTRQAQALANSEISSVELTQLYLQRIKQLDPCYKSYITVTEELALTRAQEADRKIKVGNAHALTGIPLAYKDNFCTKGVLTTCGSKMLSEFKAPYESTVTERLEKAGAVMLGKTNMDEFAMGSSTETSFFGNTKNPWDLEAIPGGSSGGSAVAVSARLAAGAIGTDTGGSIRQPCSHCGITGIKPTYGRVSRYGMVAYASSLDQAGAMGHSAEDVALLLNAFSGFDAKDSTSVDKAVPDYSAYLGNSIKGVVMGLPREYFQGGLDKKVEQCILDGVAVYEKMGAKIKEVSLSNSDLALAAYYVLAPAEASSNLSRFDGAHFGYRCDNPRDLQDLYFRSRSEGFGEEVKRRVLVGTYALSSGYHDAYYVKAQKLRRLIRDEFLNIFKTCQVIVAPNAATPAFNVGEKKHDPVAMYQSDAYTVSVNLAGLPAMSIPVGILNNRPVGLQLIGPHFEEALLLNLAHQFQRNTDWHRQVPVTLQEGDK